MTGFPFLAATGFFMDLLAVLFVISCIILILIILVQKGKGGGLSSAFGGGMASGILGSKTGDFLTWVTIVFVGIMLTLSVVLVKYWKPGPTEVPGASGTTSTQQQPASSAPAATPAPPASAPAPPTEEAPESTTDGAGMNGNNSAAAPSGTSVTEESTPSTENTQPAGASTNGSSDINQPAN